MCKIGDILLIYNAKNKVPIGAHPFIVLDDTSGKVSGMYSYDFIGLLMSSADTKEKKDKLKKYESNLPISSDDKIMSDKYKTQNKYSYLKVDQFFYFDKQKIRYIQIGSLVPDIFNLIVEFIEELSSKGVTFKQILDKAEKIEPEI